MFLIRRSIVVFIELVPPFFCGGRLGFFLLLRNKILKHLATPASNSDHQHHYMFRLGGSYKRSPNIYIYILSFQCFFLSAGFVRVVEVVIAQLWGMFQSMDLLRFV